MNTSTHYVVSNRYETDPASRRTRADALRLTQEKPLPRRVYRWGVDGPWLLAWGSENAHGSEFDAPVQRPGLFKHWFRRDVAHEL